MWRRSYQQSMDSMHSTVEELTISRFNSLKKSGKPHSGEYTVLSGLLIDGQIVSLATGLSCLNGLQLSDQGDTVNDCHAEILCIRSFRAFLYHQMTLAINAQDSILDFDYLKSIPFKLKDGKMLHLYISQAPCGDASMDLLESRQTDEEIKKNVEKLRENTKSLRECLTNGNIIGKIQRGRMDYSQRSVARTKPGRIDSIPTISMSCTDKLLLMNIVGVLGSLLSFLIEPIYISTITIGDYDQEALKDSLYSRIKNCSHLPKGFHQNYPDINTFTSSFDFKWSPINPIPCPLAIVWNLMDGSQVLDSRGMKLGSSRKDSVKCKSFVTSLELLVRFSQVIKSMNGFQDVL